MFRRLDTGDGSGNTTLAEIGARGGMMKRLVVLFAAIVLGALASVPVASASKSTCTVTNRSTRESFADLQSAVNAASAGDTLRIQGTCPGTTTVAIDLTLTGRQPGLHAAPPTLDGGGAGSVLTVAPGANVAIKSLTITDGATTAGDLGGGITDDGGVVTVSHSLITANSAMFGGGIENDQGEVVVDQSTITDNAATVDGGGIDTFPSGTVTVSGDSRVSDNTAGLNGGGIAHFGSGALTLRGTTRVNGNSAPNGGGGIYDAQTGTVTLRNASSVNRNTAGGDGGAINSHGGGTVVMRGRSTIRDNTAGGDGGGIFNNGGVLEGVVPRRNVFGNAPDDVA